MRSLLPQRYYPTSTTFRATEKALQDPGVKAILVEAALRGEDRWFPLGQLRDAIEKDTPIPDTSYRAAQALLEEILAKRGDRSLTSAKSEERDGDAFKATQAATQELIAALEANRKIPDEQLGLLKSIGASLAEMFRSSPNA